MRCGALRLRWRTPPVCPRPTSFLLLPAPSSYPLLHRPQLLSFLLNFASLPWSRNSSPPPSCFRCRSSRSVARDILVHQLSWCTKSGREEAHVGLPHVLRHD